MLRSGPYGFPGLGAGLRLHLLADGGLDKNSYNYLKPYLLSYRLRFV